MADKRIIVSIEADAKGFNQGIDKAIEGIDELNQALDQTEAEMRNISATAGDVGRKIDSSFSGAKKSVRGMDGSLGNARSSIGNLGSSLANARTSAADFERKFKDIGNGLDLTAKKGSTMRDVVGGAMNGLSSQAAGLATAFAGMFAIDMFKELAVSAFNSAAAFEANSNAFEVMLGSASAAESLMQDLSAFAASTPFELPELQNSAKKLLAFGIASGEILPTLQQLGDLAAGLGIPLEELSDIFGKMRTQGRLMSEDLNQLTGRGIPVIAEFAKQFGVAESEVKKLASQGKISFSDLQVAIGNLTKEGGKFGGLMAKQSQSLGGLLSTLKDNFNAILRDIALSVAPKIKEAFAGIGGELGKIDVKPIASAIGLVVDLFAGWFRFMTSTIIPMWKNFFGALSDGFTSVKSLITAFFGEFGGDNANIIANFFKVITIPLQIFIKTITFGIENFNRLIGLVKDFTDFLNLTTFRTDELAKKNLEFIELQKKGAQEFRAEAKKTVQEVYGKDGLGAAQKKVEEYMVFFTAANKELQKQIDTLLSNPAFADQTMIDDLKENIRLNNVTIDELKKIIDPSAGGGIGAGAGAGIKEATYKYQDFIEVVKATAEQLDAVQTELNRIGLEELTGFGAIAQKFSEQSQKVNQELTKQIQNFKDDYNTLIQSEDFKLYTDAEKATIENQKNIILSTLEAIRSAQNEILMQREQIEIDKLITKIRKDLEDAQFAFRQFYLTGLIGTFEAQRMALAENYKRTFDELNKQFAEQKALYMSLAANPFVSKELLNAQLEAVKVIDEKIILERTKMQAQLTQLEVNEYLKRENEAIRHAQRILEIEGDGSEKLFHIRMQYAGLFGKFAESAQGQQLALQKRGLEAQKLALELQGKAFEIESGKFTAEYEKVLNELSELEKDAEAQRKKRIKEDVVNLIDGFTQVMGEVFNLMNTLYDAQIQRMDMLVEAQQERVDKAIEIADQGNAELLQAEQERLDELNRQREAFVRKQQALALLELTANSAAAIAKAAAQGGAAAPFTIAATLIALIAGFAKAKAAAQSAAGGFFEGGYTGDIAPQKAAGVVHGREFVFDAKTTAKNRKWFEVIHKNKMDLGELFLRTDLHKSPTIVLNNDNSQLIEEMRLTRLAIKKQKTSVTIGEDSILDVVNRKQAKEIRRKKRLNFGK